MNSIATWIIPALLGAIVAGAAGWITWGRRLMDRGDIEQIVVATALEREQNVNLCETRCPYIPDRSMIATKLATMATNDERTLAELAELRSSTARILALMEKRTR